MEVASKFQIIGKTNQNKIINFQIEKFEKLIGISIITKEIDKILSSLGFKCKKSQKAIKVGTKLETRREFGRGFD